MASAHTQSDSMLAGRLPSLWFAALSVLLAWACPVVATVPLEGMFVANRDCLATISIKHADSGEAVRLEPGHAYHLLGKNKVDASHYQVLVDGARPAGRWVEAGCGSPAADRGDAPRASLSEPGQAPAVPSSGPPSGSRASTEPPAKSKPGAFVLALSWQPAFCEVNRRRAECGDQDRARPDASRFSLHGLWPQPRDNGYCGIDARTRRVDRDGHWSVLPALDLSPATRERLDALMPGTRSALHRHEWIAHGTCYGTDAEAYFRHAMALLEQVNDSPVRSLFADNRGKHLSSNEVRAAFDAAFGAGSGERVRLVCNDGMIGELRLSLKGQIDDASRIGALMRSAPPLSPRCRGGRVDEAGFE
jgi:ribonuclease T2